MARLFHPNIVRVFGGCLTPPNLFQVTELMQGDLSGRIHPKGGNDRRDPPPPGRDPPPPLDLRQALLTALDIARGLVRAMHFLLILSIHHNCSLYWSHVFIPADDFCHASLFPSYPASRCTFTTWTSSIEISSRGTS
jgi:hypothetical protein